MEVLYMISWDSSWRTWLTGTVTTALPPFHCLECGHDGRNASGSLGLCTELEDESGAENRRCLLNNIFFFNMKEYACIALSYILRFLSFIIKSSPDGYEVWYLVQIIEAKMELIGNYSKSIIYGVNFCLEFLEIWIFLIQCKLSKHVI